MMGAGEAAGAKAAAGARRLLLCAAADHLAATVALVDAATALCQPVGDSRHHAGPKSGTDESGRDEGGMDIVRDVAEVPTVLAPRGSGGGCNGRLGAAAKRRAGVNPRVGKNSSAGENQGRLQVLRASADSHSSITASSAHVATAAKASVSNRRNDLDVQLHITISASPLILQGEALQQITSQIIFHDPTQLDSHSAACLTDADTSWAAGAGPGCGDTSATQQRLSCAAEQSAAECEAGQGACIGAEEESAGAGCADHGIDNWGHGSASLLLLQSAASAGIAIDECAHFSRGWILDLLILPENGAAAVRGNCWWDDGALAAALRAVASGPTCVPRNDQISVTRLAADDASSAGSGMELWSAEVRESADLGPLVPQATRLAAALVQAGRDGRLRELLKGCRIVDCRPLPE